MTDCSALENKEALQILFQKRTTKILNRFRRKEITAEIFIDFEKACIKVNRAKTLEQLINMGIQGRMMEFIEEPICERWIKVRVWIHFTEQTDRPGNPTGRSA